MIEIERTLDGGHAVIMNSPSIELTLIISETNGAILYVNEQRGYEPKTGAITEPLQLLHLLDALLSDTVMRPSAEPTSEGGEKEQP